MIHIYNMYQLDHLRGNTHFTGYSNRIDMANTTEDHVFFEWYMDIDPTKYSVVVESMDTAGPTYRSIGKLSHNKNAKAGTLKLPNVVFDPHARIGVIPSSKNMPSFEGELSRGSTYKIPCVNKNGTYKLRRHGAIGLGF